MKIPRQKLTLPPLPYHYDGLEPVTSAKALKIHYEGHHGGYVKKFNELLKKGGSRDDLEFNYSGHILHSRFWENLSPLPSEIGPKTELLLKQKYNDPYEFLEELVSVSLSIKGSGWAVAVIDRGNLKVTHIANHNLRDIVHADPLLVLDAWEHGYYIDYANQKKKYFENIIELVNWDMLEKRIP